MRHNQNLFEWLEVFHEVAARKDVTPADKNGAEKEYGNVKFADTKNKKYPIDSPEHCKAALSYFSMNKNMGKYSDADRKTIASKIAAAAKKFGINATGFKKAHGMSEMEEAMDAKKMADCMKKMGKEDCMKKMQMMDACKKSKK